MERDRSPVAALPNSCADSQFGGIPRFYPLRTGTVRGPLSVMREELLDRFADDFELIAEWEPRSYPNRQGRERLFYGRKRA